MGIKVNGIKKITDLVAATAINISDCFMIQTENGSRKATGATLKTLINNTISAYDNTVQVTGTTPTITALSGARYICGEVATLDFTPCASGICDVVFTSGSTPAVVTLPNTVKFPDGSFTVEADKTYEINILDGVYGVVMAWT